MADLFHRLVAPTYYTGGGTFPTEVGVTYDYVNNGGAGTPSNADTAKIGGPNAGTYFTAFGEDATSNNVNRPALALSQNNDHLDNILHRSIATTFKTGDATAVGPVSSIVLPINTFLGVAGYTSPADLNKLFEVVDSTDEEIIDPGSGSTVKVSSVTLGAGDVIGGGGASGNFSANTVTINFTPSIPNGAVYRIYYGTRANLATLPLDALTSITIRTAEEINGSVENLFRLLHGNSEAWNAAWDSTVFDLADNALNDRYNLSTTASPSSPDDGIYSNRLNTPGGGGWILRTGPALGVYSGGDTSGKSYTDPMNALYAAQFQDATRSTSGGTTGYVAYGSRLSGTAITGETNKVPGAAMFLGLWPHHFQNTISTIHPYTRIVEWSTASLSMVGGFDADTGEAIVQCTGANNYFRVGGNSAISLGYDMLECIFTVAGIQYRESFVVVTHGASNDVGSNTKVRVRRLDGTVPDFSAPPTAATLRWHSASFAVGDGAGKFHQVAHSYADTQAVQMDGLFYQAPQFLSSLGGEDNITRYGASLSAWDTTTTSIALRWGGFSKTVPSGPIFPSALKGDGSLLVGTNATVDGLTITNTLGVASTSTYLGLATFDASITSDATGAGTPGITSTGDTTHPGGLFTGGATGNGIQTTGGATSGDGLHATGGANGHGLVAVGGGTGSNDGLHATGGSTSGKGAVLTGTGGGLGASVGSDTGDALHATGGSGGRAAVLTGTPNNTEAVSIFGSGAVPGTLAVAAGLNVLGGITAGGASAVAASFSAGAGTGPLAAVTLPVGHLYVPTNIASNADPGNLNALWGNNIVKAWARLFLNNGVFSVLDGYNITGAAIGSGNPYVKVSFAHNMTSPNYSVAINFGVADPAVAATHIYAASMDTNHINTSDFQFGIYDVGSAGPAWLAAGAVGGLVVGVANIVVLGH